MIFDTFVNVSRYTPLHQGFKKAIDFLLREDLQELPTGTYQIDGDNVFAIVAKESGRQKENAELETHEKYIDIQLVLAGVDTMGWKTKLSCTHPTDGYDAEEDIEFFKDEPDVWFATTPGFFAIFFPEDAHLPLISSGQIHKVVVKIAVEQK